MTRNHLLSASLFTELFQHNLVSPDGRIIANEQQLRDYSTFLIKQSKDRVTSLYAERKNLVDDVEELLRLGIRTEEEEELLWKLINELDLKLEENEFLSLKEPRKPQKRYLGPKEPKKSVFERKIEAELQRVKILKRDLKKLDEWLEQISHLSRMSDQKEHLIDWKESGMKYRQRTTNRMCDMENARTKLIKQHYKDYDSTLKSLLNRKLPKEKYLTRLLGSKEKTPKGMKDREDAEKSLDHKVKGSEQVKLSEEFEKEPLVNETTGLDASTCDAKCDNDTLFRKGNMDDATEKAALLENRNVPEKDAREKDSTKDEDVIIENTDGMIKISEENEIAKDNNPAARENGEKSSVADIRDRTSQNIEIKMSENGEEATESRANEDNRETSSSNTDGD